MNAQHRKLHQIRRLKRLAGKIARQQERVVKLLQTQDIHSAEVQDARNKLSALKAAVHHYQLDSEDQILKDRETLIQAHRDLGWPDPIS